MQDLAAQAIREGMTDQDILAGFPALTQAELETLRRETADTAQGDGASMQGGGADARGEV